MALPRRNFRRRRTRPLIIGLTGSIGMGKSAVSAMFARLGVPVFDADAEVRRLQGPGGRALAAIEAAFPGTTGAAGVDRPALGAAVFGKPAALRRLEAIIHPLVGASRQNFLRRHRRAPVVLLDVPLLLEGEGWRAVDLIVVVSAPLADQRARVLARPGMTAARFEEIRAQQMPDAEKRARADMVIDTGTSLLATKLAVRRLMRRLSFTQRP